MALKWIFTSGQPGIETDLHLPDGRTLHVYDTPTGNARSPVVFWHHGTPNLGKPPRPLFEASEKLGVRWVALDRPGYGGSTRVDGRNLLSVARDVEWVVDQLGIHHFGVMGHSGGGPHALACAALFPDRVTGAVTLGGLAPYGSAGLDWFGGMHSTLALEAALQGRAAKEAFEADPPEWDPQVFTPEDFEALDGKWAWLNHVVEGAMQTGPEGLIADDLAYVSGWGFDPSEIQVPVLLVHGAKDRMVPATHSQHLARHIPHAALWMSQEDGHISILNHAEKALAWLVEKNRA